ncbi:hypothetical protein SMIR_14630 [Streptomyces mirabilis]|uniref:hypothetical protein n=1 Tax=Streptomyces mirabilis TaxID=68239 RepID=UPI001BAED6C2|nr:hypothetical protein [Streptomyces mirabilis]QUW80211.1 hypothetical protein SMIR_14630 [Streptomyces mirabilis]
MFQVRMRLVPEKNEVRSLDQQYEVTWVGGTPSLSISAEVQRGQVRTVSKQWTLGGGEDGGLEVTETFSFDSSELKNPLHADFFILVTVMNSADSEGWRSPWPILRTPVTQLAVAAVVLGGLYFAPGFRRLARTTRLALLGPLACAVPVFVALWPCAVAA